ncbi:MAG TPA: sugar phosphate nucleotidyltransferase [Syntrophomonadaceae bacterium]|nr:sugar phosphate nucleotidyltransferase [Syntrophomonadaceae bacterium]
MIAIILAGGKGVRLWPESRMDKPKQLCSFFGNRTMLEHTIDRFSPLNTSEGLIITVQNQEDMINEQLASRKHSMPLEIISEPMGRNTAPALGLALAKYLDRGEEQVVGIFPADHFVRDIPAFHRVIEKALEAAAQGCLVTVGIAPTYPETGYGYIHKSDRLPGSDGIYQVAAFKEKPDIATALEYIQSGDFFWNSGMFFGRIGVLLEEYRKYLPVVYENIMKGYAGYLASYENLPDISIDYAIAEKSQRVAMVAGDFGWSDVGSWKALAELLESDGDNNVLLGDDILALGVEDCLVKQSDKTIVLLEVKGLIVIETKDVVLICPKDKSQEVKRIVDALASQGRDVLL